MENFMITLQEYHRRWDVIIEAFRAGVFSPLEASQAMADLTQTRINHHAEGN
jgi:hypothetical protein